MSKVCQICKRKEVVEAYKPFCSKRCADVDLNRWLSGGYAVPVETPDEMPGRDFPKPAND